MATVAEIFELGLRQHQAGRLAEAEALYRQVLAADPKHAGAWHFLGVLAHQMGRHDLAIQWIQQALALRPNEASAYSNLGEAYRAQGSFREALAAYDRALTLAPTLAEPHFNRGQILQRLGQSADAASAFRRATELRATWPEAHFNLGVALRAGGQPEPAMAAYRRGLQLRPDWPEALNNLGNALRDCGQLTEAVTAYRRAIAQRPNYPDSLGNLASALADLGRLEEAATACQQALALQPTHQEAKLNLAKILALQGRLDEAVAACRNLLESDPNNSEGHNCLGAALAKQGRMDDATTALQRSLQLRQDHALTWNNLGGVQFDRGDIDEAIFAYRRALEIQPQFATTHSNLIYTLLFHPGEKQEEIAAEQRRWNEQFDTPPNRLPPLHPQDRDPERRLRIGYVSPDLRDHVIGRNLIPLFREHDRTRFEIFAYSDVLKPDSLTAGLQKHTGRWRNVAGISDEDLAKMIREDGIDILVDLTQHLAGNRLPMFARRPAPVQVSFAGYPASAGVDAIPWRISDRWLEPAAERVSRLDSFWCYDPNGLKIAVNDLPARQKGCITFGSLNSFSKVNEAVLKLWARVLGGMSIFAPHSRLLLLSPEGNHRHRITTFLEREGLSPDHVEFAVPRPRRDYLELYHRLDIVLDPFPYNGHTTSLDALWMGVPVVTLIGQQPVSRAGWSQLSNLGLQELAAHSEADYVRIAVELAQDLARLAELRATLRPRMEASVLMDAKHFARQIESAYREMWKETLKAEA